MPGYKPWSQRLTVAAGRQTAGVMATLERDNSRVKAVLALEEWHLVQARPSARRGPRSAKSCSTPG